MERHTRSPSPKMITSKTSPVIASAGRSSSDSQRSMPSRPSSAVVTVTAPVLEKTSFNGLKKFDVMAKFLHQRVQQSKWLEEYHENTYFGTANLGAFVRRSDATYARTTQNGGVLKAIERIAPTVAFTMSCDSVSVLLDSLTPEQKTVDFMDGSTLFVVSSIAEAKDYGAYASLGSFTVLCRREHFILVCASSPPELLTLAASLEAHLVAMIWGGPIIAPPAAAFNPMLMSNLPRSTSMPTVSNDFSAFAFGEQPDLSLAHSKLPDRRMSTAAPMQNPQMQPPPQHPPMPLHRRASSANYPPTNTQPSWPQQNFPPHYQPHLGQTNYAHMRQPHIAGPPQSTSPFAVDEEEQEPQMFSRPLAHPMRRPSMPSMDGSPIRKPSAARRPSLAKNNTIVAGVQRSTSVSGHPARSKSFGGHGHGHGHPNRNLSIDSVPEDDVPDMPAFPARKMSLAAAGRNMSVSSTYMGQYRGSISMDIASKLEFVERAMEIEEQGEQDLEMQKDKPRPFILTHACLVSCASCLVVVIAIWSAANLVSEIRLDGSYTRLLLLLTIPMFSIFSLFFTVVISGSFFQLFGPLGFLQQNSRYYSANAPKLSEHEGEELPHITVQMPVYKEGLKGVIVPTITSVLKAVNYYVAHGGTATILVCDDGMQLISEDLQEARKVFYELHNVAWVARPKQNTTPGDDYFLRKGKFKKASNMNYALDFSGRVEDEFLIKLDEFAKEHNCTTMEVSVEDEDEIYEAARQKVEESDGGRTWSAGDVRIGEFILIIDSDTIVPESCLLCGALEMMESPDVAILQHSSGVMNMTHNTFENGITYFTELIYTSITHAVGGGDVAPFVGHNAFLRWKAIQSIAFQEDGRTKFWSENHVSEDFEVSLRLQEVGFVVRMAGYHNNEFKEGVSLTVYDELARWEKYAYGCNELLFFPLIEWPRKGIFTPLFMKFIRSNVKITSKFTIIAYIGTYYAIAVGFPLSVVNYFICGWRFQLDHYYQSSWKIFVGLAVVYNLLSPISFAMLRYRMGQCSYIQALKDCMKWTPLFMLFFGGLSYHLNKALMCHLFSINIEWTTTAKELEKTGFKIGLDRVFRDFWKMYAVMIPMVVAMVYLGAYAPSGWRITDFTVLVPIANQIGCHVLLPFALGLF